MVAGRRTNMQIEFVATSQLSDKQQTALTRLRAAAYPTEVLATLPGTAYTWSVPQWSLLLWEQDQLVSHVGVVVRDVDSNGQIKQIGGIGGVMTDSAKQGQGLASRTMREAAIRLDKDLHVTYALLFCRQELVPFYSRLQWKPFQGQVFVEQSTGTIDFTANGAMVLDVNEHAPLAGKVDLQGLPW